MTEILTWKVSNGFNCYIDIHPACNATCPFCIAETIGRKSGPLFFDGLEYALKFAERVRGTIQIVGGEPMISRRLPLLLDAMSRHSFRRVVLNTNGSMMTQNMVEHMASAGVTHVNMSRHHYDETLNQRVMNIKPAIDNKMFQGAVDMIRDFGIKVRVQACLIDGYIDSLPKMVCYIEWCKRMGVREVSFSQLFPLKSFDYQLEPVPGYTQNQRVDLRSIIMELYDTGEFTIVEGPRDTTSHGGSTTSTWGSHQKRRFWEYPSGIKFSIKTLSGYDKDGLPREEKYDKNEDEELTDGLLSFAVLHADGLLTASWDRRERIIYTPHNLSPVLEYVETGIRPARLAMLADGLAVQRVMNQCKTI